VKSPSWDLVGETRSEREAERNCDIESMLEALEESEPHEVTLCVNIAESDLEEQADEEPLCVNSNEAELEEE
jgi:hypothetical protein